MESSSNVFKFQGSKMIVCAKGPNIDKKFNMTSSFRSNLLSSTMNMPRNFEKQSYTESVVSQRSIYGRESSPSASIRSDLQPRNFHQPFYQRGFSQRSVYQGRGGSPASMRSIDSSVSIATDIVEAISSGKLNKYECKMITQALNNRRNHDYWRKAEKRRKMRMYLKKFRNRPGDDSGEPWSSSSSSSDDCASTRTGYSRRYDKNYKENVPQNINNMYGQSEDIFRNDDRDSYRGYTGADPQNPYQRDPDTGPANILSYQREPQVPSKMYFSQKIGFPNKSSLCSQNNSVTVPKNTFSSQMSMTHGNMFSTQKNILNSSTCSTKSMQNMTTMSQKDRFRGGFQFPSQKFNKSSVLHEQREQIGTEQFSKKECANSRRNLLTEHIEEDRDEHDDIFLDTIMKPKPVTMKHGDSRQKRKAESLGNLPTSAKKKPKITTINNDKTKSQTRKKNNNEKNDFEFVKPQLPVRKPAPAKSREKLISKSSNAPALVFDAQEKETIESQPVAAASPEPEEGPDRDNQSENTHMTTVTSDLSMRPSFMKRKLFTQTLDVTERKNSNDSLGTDSPQSNIYSVLSREKHKTRKLVSGQSLLQRDVQDDNNLLDLIHKIVPPSQVNCTNNVTKSFYARTSGCKAGESDDKLDITSIISACNDDSVSETYTDDEIFKVDEKDKKLQEKPTAKQTNLDKSKAVSAKPEGKKTNDTAKPEGKKTNDTAKPEGKKTNDTAKPKGKKTNDTAKPEGKETNDTSKLGGKKTNNSSGKLEGKRANDKIAKPEHTENNDNINKISRVVLTKLALPAAPKIQTPVKTYPAKKVVVSSSRIDAFWNTDVESDYECATPRAATPLHPRAQPVNYDMVSPEKNTTEIRLTKLSTQNTKTKSHFPSPAVVLKNDTTLVKVLKKQASKTLKECEPETLNITNDDTTPHGKRGRPKKGTPTIKLLEKKQINQPTTSEIVKNTQKRKLPSPNRTATTGSATRNSRNNDKKGAQETNNVLKSSAGIPKNPSRRQIDSQQMGTSKKLEDTPKRERRAMKNTTKHIEHVNADTCKVLRSRVVDLSSTFDSDKFELTMSRTRKSRTPSRRISFNKLINVLPSNKTRARATKA